MALLWISYSIINKLEEEENMYITHIGISVHGRNV